jgi:hypothetical protein
MIVAAKDPSSFTSRLQEAVRSMLWTIGVSHDALQQELQEMADVTIRRTTSRIVLGSMNELALQAHFALGQQPELLQPDRSDGHQGSHHGATLPHGRTHTSKARSVRFAASVWITS